MIPVGITPPPIPVSYIYITDYKEAMHKTNLLPSLYFKLLKYILLLNIINVKPNVGASRWKHHFIPIFLNFNIVWNHMTPQKSDQ